jgi:hypothetical protein
MKKYLVVAFLAVALYSASSTRATPTISLCAVATGCSAKSGASFDLPNLYFAGSSPTIYFDGSTPNGAQIDLAIIVPLADASGNFRPGVDLWKSMTDALDPGGLNDPPGNIPHSFDFSQAQLIDEEMLGLHPLSFSVTPLFEGAWNQNPTAITTHFIPLESLSVGTLIVGYLPIASPTDSNFNPSEATPWNQSLIVVPDFSAPTPEPASILLFGTGLLGIVILLRKNLLA